MFLTTPKARNWDRATSTRRRLRSRLGAQAISFASMGSQ